MGSVDLNNTIGEREMFLVQIDKNIFVNAEEIDYIRFDKEKITFSLRSDGRSMLTCSSPFDKPLINHLQAINKSIASIESEYINLTEEDLER